MADKKQNKYAGLLRKYLTKVGVKDFTQLSAEEQSTYNEWEEVLAKEVTLKDVTDFIRKQLEEQNQKLREAVTKGNHRGAQIHAARIENYEALLGAIEEPERTKEALAQHIEQITGDT